MEDPIPLTQQNYTKKLNRTWYKITRWVLFSNKNYLKNKVKQKTGNKHL